MYELVWQSLLLFNNVKQAVNFPAKSCHWYVVFWPSSALRCTASREYISWTNVDPASSCLTIYSTLLVQHSPCWAPRGNTCIQECPRFQSLHTRDIFLCNCKGAFVSWPSWGATEGVWLNHESYYANKWRAYMCGILLFTKRWPEEG